MSADFTIAQGIPFWRNKVLPFLLLKNGSLKCTSPANKIGSIIFKASISSAEKRKTYNNSKNFAVEVIDQKTISNSDKSSRCSCFAVLNLMQRTVNC
jgi:aminopeptidase C